MLSIGSEMNEFNKELKNSNSKKSIEINWPVDFKSAANLLQETISEYEKHIIGNIVEILINYIAVLRFARNFDICHSCYAVKESDQKIDCCENIKVNLLVLHIF